MFNNCIEATNADLERINSLIRRSKAFWGYDEIFMDLFCVTEFFIHKNVMKLYCEREKITVDRAHLNSKSSTTAT